jgi:hypothetical protein
MNSNWSITILPVATSDNSTNRQPIDNLSWVRAHSLFKQQKQPSLIKLDIHISLLYFLK